MDVHSTTNISDRIAEQLLDRIRTEGLSVGDLLPSERDLMKEFGVSRLACREALAKLQGMGILKARHGKGAYLADIRDLSVAPAVLRLLQVHGDISNANVLEARMIIEPAAAGLAASRANSAQRDALVKQALDATQGLADLPVVERAQRFAEEDVTFHQAVAAGSGNPVIPMLFRTMHELLLRVRLEVLILQPDIIWRALADHRKIATAVASRDVKAAQKAMERHIRLRGKELLRGETASKDRQE